MNIKPLLLSSVCVLSLFGTAHADQIETTKQAKEFLDSYCVDLVNEIAQAVERQRAHAVKENWEGFLEQGAYISGVSEVYGNLCK